MYQSIILDLSFGFLVTGSSILGRGLILTQRKTSRGSEFAQIQCIARSIVNCYCRFCYSNHPYSKSPHYQNNSNFLTSRVGLSVFVFRIMVPNNKVETLKHYPSMFSNTIHFFENCMVLQFALLRLLQCAAVCLVYSHHHHNDKSFSHHQEYYYYHHHFHFHFLTKIIVYD